MSWLPSDLPALKLWYRADSLVLSDGDPVPTWEDESGNGHDLAQATAANQPLYRTDALLHVPVVRFDGTNDRMLTSAFTAVSQPTEFFALARCRQLGRDNVLFDGIGSSNRQHGAITATNKLRIYAGTVVDSGANADTDWHIWHWAFNGAGSFTRVDGAAFHSGNAGSQTLTGLTMGSWQGLTNFGMWDVVEFVMNAGSLTDTQRGDVVAYLTTRLTGVPIDLTAEPMHLDTLDELDEGQTLDLQAGGVLELEGVRD